MSFSQKLSETKGNPFSDGFSFDELLKHMKGDGFRD